jgi:hypothetical protein
MSAHAAEYGERGRPTILDWKMRGVEQTLMIKMQDGSMMQQSKMVLSGR